MILHDFYHDHIFGEKESTILVSESVTTETLESQLHLLSVNVNYYYSKILRIIYHGNN